MSIFDTFFGQLSISIAIIIFFMLTRKLIIQTILNNLTSMAEKTNTTLDNDLLKAIKKPAQLFYINIGFTIALNTVTFSNLIEKFLNDCIKTIFILVLFWILYDIVNPITYYFLKNKKDQKRGLGTDLLNIILKFIQIFILALGIITILQQWGYNITGFLASLGLVGMAVALAAKDTVANLFGSLVIFTDKPFKIGDWIKTSNVEGIVESVGIRSTKVRTFAQAVVSVPNATLANTEILNWSRMGKRRIKMSLGLTYSTSTQQMQDVVNEIRQMLKEDTNIHQDTIHIYFTDFEASSLGIFCYFFTKSTNWAEYMRVREDVNLKIMKIVESHNCEFAFPTQSIFIENDNKLN